MNGTLDYVVLMDIRSNCIRAFDADELATYVCERWKIDHVKDIRAVYRAIKEAHPNLK
jgi:hypothetical protein